MTREELKKYISNIDLIHALEGYNAVSRTLKDIEDAIAVCQRFDINHAELDERTNEYRAYKNGYDLLFEDAFRLRWQQYTIIARHTNLTEEGVDNLPTSALQL